MRVPLPRPRLPILAVACAAALPPLAVLVVREPSFEVTLYRAPKDLLYQVTAWAMIVCAIASSDILLARCGRAARNPPVLLLMLWIAWSAVSGLWATTPSLARSSLIHWLTAGSVMLVLVALLELPSFRAALVAGWCGSAALVTLLAAGQALGWLPLVPIDPEIAKTWPATWGWKNPAAHFIAGQLWVLAGAASSATTRRGRWGLSALVVLETLYLSTLQSRTAMLAVALGAGALLLGTRGLAPPARRRALAGILVAGTVTLSAVLAQPASRDRLSSALELLGEPALYLESDRGQYLRSTLLMVRAHPFGVGLGSWQSEYPVHRVSALGANNEHEARRAHSDWVQALGEGGWVGLGLWAGFWIALAQATVRRFRSPAGSPSRDLLLLAQVVTAGAAGLTDYVVEMPVFRFYLAALVALVVARPTPVPPESQPETQPRRVRWAFAAASLAALYVAWAAAAGIAADREARVMGLLRSQSPDSDRLQSLSAQLRRLPMASATEHRVFLATAARALAAGDLPSARRDLELASARSPWNPQGFALRARLAELEGDSRQAERWRRCGRALSRTRIDGHPPCG